MKTTAVVAALLASVAMAQPHHGRHVHQKKDLDKRKYETEWVTETQWATLYIDENGTTLQGPSPAQFYPSTTSEETSTTSTSTPESTSEPSTSTTPGSTSIQPEPTTYSTPEAATVESEPTTTSQVPVYTPTTTEAAQPTSASGGGSSGGASSYTGDLTFYDLVGPGACGTDLVGMTPGGTSTSDLAVVAISHLRFTNEVNPNNDPLCGKIVKFTVGDKSGYGRVMDKCMGCAEDDLDINPEAFNCVALASAGRVKMTWDFL